MKMKKIFSAVMALTIAIGLFTVLMLSVYAAPTTATLSGPKTLAPGGQFTLELKTSEAVAGFQLDLEYDETQLELVKYTTVNNWMLTEGDGRFIVIDFSGQTLETDIFALTFKVKNTVETGDEVSVTLRNLDLTLIENDTSTGVQIEKVSWSGKVASNDATLKSLTVTGYNIKFKPATTRYNLTVENDVTKLEVSAEVNDPKATMKITNPSSLKVGNSNRVRVYVTAEDGTEKTYTIVVTRQAIETEPPKSSDCSLKSLSVAGVEIGFEPDKTQYTLEVENSVDKLDIHALTNDAGATVEVKNNALVAGEKVTVQVIVTAENGDSRTYNLHVTRKAPETEPPKSSDNTLKSLGIANVTFTFDPNQMQYAFEVENEVEALTIEAVPGHEGATVEVKNNTLVVGETVTVQIVVTAENGNTRTYSLDVTRKAAETPPVTSGSVSSGDPAESGTDPVPKPSDTDPATDQTVFWLNAIYIIILVGCLLVIALLLVLLVIYRRMNNSAEH